MPVHEGSRLAACKSDSSVFHYCNEGPASAKGCLAPRQNKLRCSRTTGPFPSQRRERGERGGSVWAEKPRRSSVSLPFYCHFMSQCVFFGGLRYACVWLVLDKEGVVLTNRELLQTLTLQARECSKNVARMLHRFCSPSSVVLYGDREWSDHHLGRTFWSRWVALRFKPF